MDKIKKWCHRINLTSITLEPELDAFSEEGWEIYRIWNVGHDKYEIVAYKEDVQILPPQEG